MAFRSSGRAKRETIFAFAKGTKNNNTHKHTLTPHKKNNVFRLMTLLDGFGDEQFQVMARFNSIK